MRTMNLNVIAREAGVTAMTVSRVLRGQNMGRRRDAKGRADRVRAIAKRLGYRRNMAPVAMARGRFDTVGILESADWSRNHLPEDRKRGIQDGLAPHGLHLMIFRMADAELAKPDSVPLTLQNRMVDGFLLDYIIAYPQRLDALIRRYALAAVWMNSKHKADCVHPADREGIVSAVQFLVELGHRRIAFGDFRWEQQVFAHYSAADRRAGYEQTMRRAGLPPQMIAVPERIAYCDRATVFLPYLRAAERPTALITPGLTEGLAAIRAATVAGLRIPEDLALITVTGDVTYTRSLRVAALELPEYEVGYKAAEMLVKKIQRPTETLAPVAVPLKLDGKEFCLPPQKAKTVKARRRRRGGAKVNKGGGT